MSGDLSQALDAALAARRPAAVDAATVALARTYAQAIDADPDLLDPLGPKLLAALTALRMTSAARKSIEGGGTSAKPGNPLDELRARRAKRAAG